MAVLTTHRFTVTEYYRMAESGVLHPDDRVELLEGDGSTTRLGPGKVVRPLAFEDLSLDVAAVLRQAA
jgi:hypothetical protein